MNIIKKLLEKELLESKCAYFRGYAFQMLILRGNTLYITKYLYINYIDYYTKYFIFHINIRYILGKIVH